ncbi:uncharacterized protein AMSG_11684 [Thecamonas trahens ATCC 50062]|uniref:DUF11 domain-containing protein n=1 Tax=Thecamonas trahens ATCC 50062 TaxID=461836 RepID=A0A0L0DUJ7_THETB|nr:hypothetical protein AMSG_11684 [Thecamonas trahens ATCC 50062]KNC56009.1 hypothetical protein AMSG_11684 [Thecamonas trahens ATCC 50062]|eukprot:XP_013761223.1 hypothetical protein AMSG_11684 [Thecamonas trahens ATCC 50062]
MHVVATSIPHYGLVAPGEVVTLRLAFNAIEGTTNATGLLDLSLTDAVWRSALPFAASSAVAHAPYATVGIASSALSLGSIISNTADNFVSFASDGAGWDLAFQLVDAPALANGTLLTLSGALSDDAGLVAPSPVALSWTVARATIASSLAANATVIDAGDVITYTLSIAHLAGSITPAYIAFADQAPQHTKLLDGSLAAGWTGGPPGSVVFGPALAWSATLPPGSVLTISYSVIALSSLPPHTTVTNSDVLTWASAPLSVPLAVRGEEALVSNSVAVESSVPGLPLVTPTASASPLSALDTQLAVGELVNVSVAVTLPEGSHNLSIAINTTDSILTIESLSLFSVGSSLLLPSPLSAGWHISLPPSTFAKSLDLSTTINEPDNVASSGDVVELILGLRPTGPLAVAHLPVALGVRLIYPQLAHPVVEHTWMLVEPSLTVNITRDVAVVDHGSRLVARVCGGQTASASTPAPNFIVHLGHGPELAFVSIMPMSAAAAATLATTRSTTGSLHLQLGHVDVGVQLCFDVAFDVTAAVVDVTNVTIVANVSCLSLPLPHPTARTYQAPTVSATAVAPRPWAFDIQLISELPDTTDTASPGGLYTMALGERGVLRITVGLKDVAAPIVVNGSIGATLPIVATSVARVGSEIAAPGLASLPSPSLANGTWVWHVDLGTARGGRSSASFSPSSSLDLDLEFVMPIDLPSRCLPFNISLSFGVASGATLDLGVVICAAAPEVALAVVSVEPSLLSRARSLAEAPFRVDGADNVAWDIVLSTSLGPAYGQLVVTVPADLDSITFASDTPAVLSATGLVPATERAQTWSVATNASLSSGQEVRLRVSAVVAPTVAHLKLLVVNATFEQRSLPLGSEQPAVGANVALLEARAAIRVAAALQLDLSLVATSDPRSTSALLNASIPDLVVGESFVARVRIVTMEGSNGFELVLSQLFAPSPFPGATLGLHNVTMISVGASHIGAALDSFVATTRADASSIVVVYAPSGEPAPLVNVADNVIDAGDIIELEVSGRMSLPPDERSEVAPGVTMLLAEMSGHNLTAQLQFDVLAESAVRATPVARTPRSYWFILVAAVVLFLTLCCLCCLWMVCLDSEDRDSKVLVVEPGSGTAVPGMIVQSPSHVEGPAMATYVTPPMARTASTEWQPDGSPGAPDRFHAKRPTPLRVAKLHVAAPDVQQASMLPGGIPLPSPAESISSSGRVSPCLMPLRTPDGTTKAFDPLAGGLTALPAFPASMRAAASLSTSSSSLSDQSDFESASSMPSGGTSRSAAAGWSQTSRQASATSSELSFRSRLERVDELIDTASTSTYDGDIGLDVQSLTSATPAAVAALRGRAGLAGISTSSVASVSSVGSRGLRRSSLSVRKFEVAASSRSSGMTGSTSSSSTSGLSTGSLSGSEPASPRPASAIQARALAALAGPSPASRGELSLGISGPRRRPVSTPAFPSSVGRRDDPLSALVSSPVAEKE